MRFYFLAISLFLFALNFSVFAQVNQTDLLKTLLDLPAPAPFEKSENLNNIEERLEFLQKYRETNKVPADDAPIEELIMFWSLERYMRSYNKNSLPIRPSEIVVDRIFDEIKKNPNLFTNFLHILSKDEHIDFAKDYYDEKSAEAVNTDTDTNDTEPIKTVSAAIAEAENINRNSTNKRNISINQYNLKQIKEWLTFMSDRFSDDLLKKAEQVKDKKNEAKNASELIALARVDWKKAEPIVERLLGNEKNQPFSATAAKSAYYAYSIKKKDERSASKYRRMLQDIVENRKANKALRKMAFERLMYSEDFDGRDDWYLSLMEDETLFNLIGNSRINRFIFSQNTENWISKMLELVGHKSPTIHKSAVRNLTVLLGNTNEKNDKLILKALLPWLADKHWANTTNGRVKLIETYGKYKIPESIPNLIMVLQNERLTEEDLKNNNANYDAKDAAKIAVDKVKEAIRKTSNSNVYYASKDSNALNKLSPPQSAAIEALVKHKDSRVVPILQGLLDYVKDLDNRETIISAIIDCGGYSPNQQLSFLESFVRKIVTQNNLQKLESQYYGDTDDFSLNELIGKEVVEKETPDENLVRLLIGRIKTLRKSDPKFAEALNIILNRWESHSLNVERLNNVTNNSADVETIIRVLTDRKDLQKKHINQIQSMRSEGGIASGIAACLLENESEMLSALNSGDVSTKVSGLACARLLRIKIPVNVVSTYLNNSNPILSLAAERYLVSEDSFEARNLILSKYPNEAKILGARLAFEPNKKANHSNLPIAELFRSIGLKVYYYKYPLNELDKFQEKLREEVKTNQNLLGIYGFLKNETSGHKILRIYKDKAVYSWYEDDARYRERTVNNNELKQIFDYVADYQIEDMKPIIRSCHHGCPKSEFVMFGRNGGRRIYISSYYPAAPLNGLSMIFSALEQGESKLRYWLQDKIAGLEVLLDEKNIKAKSVWKNGDDLRVLIFNEKKEEKLDKEFREKYAEARKSVGFENFDESEYENKYKMFTELSKSIDDEKKERKYEAYSWRSVVNNKLGKTLSQPTGIYFIRENGEFPEVDKLDNNEKIWKTRTTDFELRFGDYKTEGVWKVFKNGLTSQIAKDTYILSPIISTDGRWVIVTKGRDYSYFGKSYLLNLQSGRETEIKIPLSIATEPIAYIESQNKFLIYSGGYKEIENSSSYILRELEKKLGEKKLKSIKSAYYLVDTNTGAVKQVKGNFQPLKQISYRNLQKTSNEAEYWAAISDEKSKSTKIGRYDMKTFKFTEELKIPEIKLDSMDIWVDEKEAKIYFIYEGHLLSLPFNSSEK